MVGILDRLLVIIREKFGKKEKEQPQKGWNIFDRIDGFWDEFDEVDEEDVEELAPGRNLWRH